MTNLDALWVLPSDIDETLDLDTIDPEDVQMLKEYETALAACEFASQTLWSLSGRKYHTGAVSTERYISSKLEAAPNLPGWLPGLPIYDYSRGVYLIDPYYWDSGKIRLDGTPIKSVAYITPIGSSEVIDPSSYKIVNRTFIQFNGATPDGFEISYSYGQQPPKSGRMAALAMARQFFYLWSGREDQCSLPDRVTSVTRQGVSWVLLDNQDFLDELKTGIYVVDLFLRSVNPDKARVKSKVFSVDIPRGQRRTL